MKILVKFYAEIIGEFRGIAVSMHLENATNRTIFLEEQIHFALFGYLSLRVEQTFQTALDIS